MWIPSLALALEGLAEALYLRQEYAAAGRAARAVAWISASPFTICGAPGIDDTPVAYGPRRTVLDKLLVDAATEAGVEVREGFTVFDGRI